MLPQLAIDSNLFIYVLENNPDFRIASLTVLKQIEAGVVVGYASELVYLELLSDKKLHAKNIAAVHLFLERTGVIFQPVNREVLVRAAQLRREHPALKTPDAIHLASALVAKATRFITNDQKLLKQKIKGLELVSLDHAL